MGIIHGLTNLGGSLLTAIVYSKEYEKHKTRVTLGIIYATFAIFQILVLISTGHILDFKLTDIAICFIVSITIFLITENTVFMIHV